MSTCSDSSFELVGDLEDSAMNDEEFLVRKLLNTEPSHSEANSHSASEQLLLTDASPGFQETAVNAVNSPGDSVPEEVLAQESKPIDTSYSGRFQKEAESPLEIFIEQALSKVEVGLDNLQATISDIQSTIRKRKGAPVKEPASSTTTDASPSKKAEKETAKSFTFFGFLETFFTFLFIGVGCFFVLITCVGIVQNRQMREKLKGNITAPVLPGDAKFQKELKFIIDHARFTLQYRAPSIKEGREKLIKTKCLEDISDYTMGQWLPDPSRFQGLNTYFHEAGGEVEKFYNEARPFFNRVNQNQIKLQWQHGGCFGLGRATKPILLSGKCTYSSEDETMKVYMKDGDLYVDEKITSGQKEWKFTRVFYIPAQKIYLF